MNARSLVLLHRGAGFSLTELLIAMVLSLAVIGTVISVFVSTKRSYLIQDNVAWMQENARHAFRKLGYDIRMSGYLGDLQEYWDLTETAVPAWRLPATADECFTADAGGGEFRWVAPMLYNDGLALPSYGPKLLGQDGGANLFNCLSAGADHNDYLAGTDVVSLHYVDPAAVANGSLVEDSFYVSTTLGEGRVFQALPAAVPPPDAPAGGVNHALYAGAYYVTPCGRTGNDGACATSDDVPALMRVQLQAGGVIGRDRVAEGVVDMQIQYGIDIDDNGLADRFIDSSNTFLDTASWPFMATVKVVRVWLLMRVREPGYNDPNGNYTYANVNVAPVNGYRYQLFSATFSVRNQYSTAASF